MASSRFDQVAYLHYQNLLDPPASNWTAAKVDTYSGPPRNYVTQDEGEAIVALAGQITSEWYDTQHAIPVAGADMPADPNWAGVLAALEAPPA